MDWTLFFDLVRIASYTVASIGLVFFALDDCSRKQPTSILWSALALQNVMVLALLALDLSAAVVWMEARYMLTPSAIFAAIAIGYNMFVRAQEMVQAHRATMRRELRDVA
jgi:hypothetical protein